MERDPLRTTAAAAADIAELADKLAELDDSEVHPTVRSYARLFAGGCRIVSRSAGAFADVARRPLAVHQDDRYVGAAFGDDLVELEGLTSGDDLADGGDSWTPPNREDHDVPPPPLRDGQSMCVRCGSIVADDVKRCPRCGGGMFVEPAP